MKESDLEKWVRDAEKGKEVKLKPEDFLALRACLTSNIFDYFEDNKSYDKNTVNKVKQRITQ